MRRQYRSGGLGSNTMGGNISNAGFGEDHVHQEVIQQLLEH